MVKIIPVSKQPKQILHPINFSNDEKALIESVTFINLTNLFWNYFITKDEETGGWLIWWTEITKSMIGSLKLNGPFHV